MNSIGDIIGFLFCVGMIIAFLPVGFIIFKMLIDVGNDIDEDLLELFSKESK